jgi:hypothetical protein
MRGSSHSTEFRVYRLTPSGAVIGEALTNFHGITTGVPTRANEQPASPIAPAGKE